MSESAFPPAAAAAAAAPETKAERTRRLQLAWRHANKERRRLCRLARKPTPEARERERRYQHEYYLQRKTKPKRTPFAPTEIALCCLDCALL